MTADSNIPTTILAESANYLVWTAEEPDGEVTFNVELGTVTLHFFREEWEEFLRLIGSLPAPRNK
jgi:hypothetical protein